MESVLHDVIEGYVTLAAAERDYKVAIHYPGSADQLVRLAAHYAIDQERARQLRAAGPTP